MTIKELIKELQTVEEKYGDSLIHVFDYLDPGEPGHVTVEGISIGDACVGELTLCMEKETIDHD